MFIGRLLSKGQPLPTVGAGSAESPLATYHVEMHPLYRAVGRGLTVKPPDSRTGPSRGLDQSRMKLSIQSTVGPNARQSK